MDEKAGSVGQVYVENNDVGRIGENALYPLGAVRATSTECSGPGNARRTCLGIRAGSSSIIRIWATAVVLRPLLGHPIGSRIVRGSYHPVQLMGGKEFSINLAILTPAATFEWYATCNVGRSRTLDSLATRSRRDIKARNCDENTNSAAPTRLLTISLGTGPIGRKDHYGARGQHELG